ncbi:MAG: hypothetical protein PVF15_00870 [Candidatus Bathyarchaeota archaeon]
MPEAIKYVGFRAHVVLIPIVLLLLGILYIYYIAPAPNLEISGNGLFSFYTREEFVPSPVSDDDQSSHYSHEGTTVTLLDDPLFVISGRNSLKIVVSETPVGTSVAYYDFVPSADWSGKDSISFFWYGAESGIAFNLLIECKEGYYRQQIVDDWFGWKQLLISFRNMENLSSPNMKQVERLSFQVASSGYANAIWRLDRVITETIDNNSVIYDITFGGEIYIRNHGNELDSVTLEKFFLDHAGAEVLVSSEESFIPSEKSLVNFNFTTELSGQDAPPLMTKFTILLRLIAENGLLIGELRSDVPTFPSFLNASQLESNIEN